MDVHITFGAPQLILSSLFFLNWVVAVSRYGEKKRDSYDWGDVFVGPVLLFTLLYWGGFYGS